MIDSIIAGTGNSRYLRSSIPAGTTWDDVLTMLQAGTFPIDLAGINAAGFTTLGTALNAENLLASATITALGLSSDATPDDALNALITAVNAKLAANQGVGNADKIMGVNSDGSVKYVSVDTEVTEDSDNLITSGAVFQVIDNLDANNVAYDPNETYSSGTVGAEISALRTDIDDYCICKNLTGSEPGVLYPVYIPAGTYIVMSTSDGNNNTKSGLQLLLYNKQKTKVEYFTFATTYSSRKVKYDGGDVYYLAWNIAPAVPMQVEIGETKTAYEEYFYSPKGLTPVAMENFSYIPHLRRSCLRLNSLFTVPGKKQGYPYCNLSDSADWMCSDFIPVVPGEAFFYKLYGQNNTAAAIGFFKADKSSLSNYSVRSSAFEYSGVATVPSDASFVRFCNKTGKSGEVVFYNDVPDSLFELTDKVPSYWVGALKTAKDTIESNRDAGSAETVEFMFITDTHWKYNAQKSPFLINKLSDMAECTNVVFGGDIICGYENTKEAALAALRAMYITFSRSLDFTSSIGNHDLNSNSNSDTTLYLSLAQAYNIMQKRSERFADNDIPNACGCWDNRNQKVRFIQIYRPYDSALPQDVKNWVSAKVGELDSSWSCVFFSHAFWSSAAYGTALTTSSQGKADADFLSDLCAANSVTPIAWIVGHTHRDYSETITSALGNDLLVICTTTDCYTYGNTESGYTMTLGTNTEQAFDYFQVDTYNKTIKATRIGAGSNRSWSY